MNNANRDTVANTPAASPDDLSASEPWRWDAARMGTELLNGTISSREITQSCLRRIEEVNPHINAITHVTADKALRAADEADARRHAKKALGPLDGVPVTIKVNVDVVGEPTTHGVEAKRDLIATANSPVVSNLLRAGAVIIGRTNTPAFSLRWFTENALHGRTLNPWNESITPGGSSGGASAAVAAGMCPIAHGNDLAGSVRYPAYACGVAGLRPTAGRVPSFTPSSGNARPFAAQFFAVQGPIARRVHDLRLALAAMSAPDTRDPVWVPAPLEFASQDQPLRVALIDEIAGVGIAPAVREALHMAAKCLETEGYIVERASGPSIMAAFDVWMTIAMTEIRTGLASTLEEQSDANAVRAFRDMQHDYDTTIDLNRYIGAFGQRDALRREWNAFLQRYPLVLMPTSCELPFAWESDQQGPEAMSRILRAQSPLKAIAALNLPGLSVPTGLSNGVPVGVQLVASAFREDLCLAAGEAIERHVQMPAAY